MRYRIIKWADRESYIWMVLQDLRFCRILRYIEGNNRVFKNERMINAMLNDSLKFPEDPTYLYWDVVYEGDDLNEAETIFFVNNL